MHEMHQTPKIEKKKQKLQVICEEERRGGEQRWRSCESAHLKQMWPGLDSRTRVISRSSLSVLYSAPKGFSRGTLVFPSHEKPTFDLI